MCERTAVSVAVSGVSGAIDAMVEAGVFSASAIATIVSPSAAATSHSAINNATPIATLRSGCVRRGFAGVGICVRG